MFDGLKRKVAAVALVDLLKSLATSKDTQTTIAGMIAGCVLTIPGLDLSRLIAGDPHQIALVLSGVAVWFIGLLATKEHHDGHTTALGVVAGVLQLCIGNVVTAVTLALCGYLTNKPVSGSSDAPTS